MTINLICVGSIKERFYTDAFKEYEKRLNAFCKFNLIELKETNYTNPTNSEIEKIKTEEGKRILEKLKKFNILLSLKGKEFTSEELADFVEEKQLQTSELTFIIGGSYGVSKEVEDKVQFKLSFSKLTFPHQLMRVILMEQIYRAFTIINNKGYHK
ncbi:MAG: 23S rRNA (pseudouridine(1915)-N(3))-methyltransferase RlmH [Clostridiales bacterium]|nr:23S rRNA (pseudouridine(1915)-N(3))-methyltransferase RlmH [Clostridiales bacterium]